MSKTRPILLALGASLLLTVLIIVGSRKLEHYDLKTVVDQLGFDYSLDDGHTLQDYCPRCKRIMRGLAYARLPRKDEEVFVGSRGSE